MPACELFAERAAPILLFGDRVLARLVLASVMLAAAPTRAAPAIAIHARCAAELARDPAHVRTLRGELALALDGARTDADYTLDVALVRLGTAAVSDGLEVRAEVRALLSDRKGRVRYSFASRATARGAAHQRALLQRDAVASAARDLAKAVRARTAWR